MALWSARHSRQNHWREGTRTSARYGRRRSAIIMDREHTAQHWLMRAMDPLQRVTNAERRFSASMSVNDVTMLAAADELEAATTDARVWAGANPCPDLELGGRVVLMLHTCTEVALTAQRAITDPVADVEAVIGRLGDLLTIIDFHSQTLDAW